MVLALFEIVGPDFAVFGQKDYQQQLLIRRMVEDLHVPVEIVTEPTVREADGLAMSSRNRYLGPEERKAAAVLSRALRPRGGRRSRRASGMPTGFDRFLTVRYHWNASVRLDYAEVADADSLEPLGDRVDPGRPLAVAAR